MSTNKLSAGSGYTYLTRQTAAHDSTVTTGQTLADYYSEKGERPGTWTGSALAGLAGVDHGDQVSEDQMKALFGEGRHPDADRLEAAAIAAGRGDDALKASELGAPFRDLNDAPSPFLVETTRAYNQWLTANGLPRSGTVPDDVRSQIRTRVGRETFEDLHSRGPLDERELASHIARMSRPRRQTVAGYDLTFSPVKSVSVLWAVADLGTSAAIQDAHDAAIADTVNWLEKEVIFTRRGKAGVRHVDVTGLIAASFTHRDSRAGEPDLHTHVAVSNKVQDPTDESWLAIDGQVLHKATVAASERYNTVLERELNDRLGLTFAPDGKERRGLRPVREIAGVPAEWNATFSTRRKDIEAAVEDLVAAFRVEHERAPSPKEATALHEQASLATRAGKHEPRSWADQRQQWREALLAENGGDDTAITATIGAVLAGRTDRTKHLTDQQVTDLAASVMATVQGQRARFQTDHLTAETQRRIRAEELDPAIEQDTVARVLAACTKADQVVRLDAIDPVTEPAQLRRTDGTSVYDTPRARLFTTTGMLAAERVVIDAAHQHSGSVVPQETVAVAMLEGLANGKKLNPAQTQLVTEMATSGTFLQLGLAPAGSGKTTSMRVLAGAWGQAFPAHSGGGGVIGLAPTAVAATELGAALGTPADTLAKLIWHLDHPGTDPAWMRTIGTDTLIVVDEAGMAATRDLATLTTFARSRGASLRLIGDDQQLASVAAGGVLRAIAADTGAVTLSELIRFAHPGEGAATLALREGDASALGFMLDNNRVRVTGDADQTAAVYEAWKTATAQHVADGHGPSAAVMIAQSNETVTELNRRAQADRATAGDVDPARAVTLASGLHAHPGDVIVTRQNNRRLPVTATDFVKNGDRWTVQDVHPTGAITVRHESLGRVITLPADYATEHVDLGYASTVHGVQGQTVRSSFLLARGQETRQLLYVAMSRGTHENIVFVPMGTDGDPHGALLPDRVVSPTAVELLEQIIARDGSQVAATTEREAQNDPATLLARAAARYADGVDFAIATVTGTERMDQIRDAANEALPGLSDSPAWGTLAAHLATLDLSGTDPIAALQVAIDARELSTADDPAAVLDYRLDPTGTHSAGTGPPPGLSGIPAAISTHAELGSWLTARADLVTSTADQLRATTTEWTPDTAPAWALDLLEDAQLVGDLAVWRAINAVPADDPTPTGRPHPSPAHRTRQRALNTWARNVTGRRAEPGAAFTTTITEHAPAVLRDPWWPILGKHLDHGTAAGRPVADYLRAALEHGPLPDEYPAAALWSRLSEHLAPAAAAAGNRSSGSTRLRPPWVPAMTAALPPGIGARVLADPVWPTLVASVEHAAVLTGLPPEGIVTRAMDLIGTDYLPHLPGDTSGDSSGITPADDAPARIHPADLAVVLAMRVGDLTYTPPALDDAPITEQDLYDADLDDFLSRVTQDDDTTPPAHDHTPTEQAPTADEPPLEEPPHEDPEATTPAPVDHAPTGITDQRVLDLTEQAAAFYAAAYPGSASAAYLTGRFGTDLSGTPFVVGHAGSDGTALLRYLAATADATPEELVDAGLARWGRHGAYDHFRGRALIGVHNQDGHLVGFNGRALTTDQRGPKYLNTPTTSVFRKGDALFGMHEGLAAASTARPDVIGVEGPMDAIAATLAGNGTVIGVAGGTGGFTESQIDQLTSYAATTNARTLWLAKDRDTAGRRVLVKDNTAFIARGITPRSLPIFGGKDLADMYAADPNGLAATLATRDVAPPAARQIVADLAHAHLGQAKNTDPGYSVWVVKRMADTIAALPPGEWADEIDEAALLFSDNTEDQDHYADLLYLETFQRAAHWDPHGTPDSTDVLAAAAVAHALDVLSGPSAQGARETRSETLRAYAKARSARRAHQTTPVSKKTPRERSRADIKRSDTPRAAPSQDGPTII